MEESKQATVVFSPNPMSSGFSSSNTKPVVFSRLVHFLIRFEWETLAEFFISLFGEITASNGEKMGNLSPECKPTASLAAFLGLRDLCGLK
jgi:hypothetical protein